MTPLTTQDIWVGWIEIALALIAIGILVIYMARSAWAETQARKAEWIITEPKFAHTLTDGLDEYEADRATARDHLRRTPEYQAAWEQHVADAIAATERASVPNVTPLPGRQLRAVPEQGQPGAWS